MNKKKGRQKIALRKEYINYSFKKKSISKISSSDMFLDNTQKVLNIYVKQYIFVLMILML